MGQLASKPNRGAGLWIGLSFVAAFSLAAAVLMVLGTGERGTRLGLLLTARLAFLPFWAAYTSSSLARLFGSAFQSAHRNARTFGLAFAAIELVHLALVAWLCFLGQAPSVRTFIVFGIAVFWTYLLVLFSVADLRKWVSPRAGWLLRGIGMNYIAYAFAVDFLRNPLAGGIGHAAFYWPFAALAIIGPGLRLAAAAQQCAREAILHLSRRA